MALKVSAQAAFAALRLPLTTVTSMEEADLGQCQAAFVGWTCFEPTTRREVTHHLERLPRGAGVVSVTHPVESAAFEQCAEERALFPWGTGSLHVAKRT
jgi:hypothetical protein